ncbi:uncharacterized protein V6R79_008797 [Siganus canaliculatus]
MPMQIYDAPLAPRLGRSPGRVDADAPRSDSAGKGGNVGVFLPECRQRCRLVSGSRSPGFTRLLLAVWLQAGRGRCLEECNLSGHGGGVEEHVNTRAAAGPGSDQDP